MYAVSFTDFLKIKATGNYVVMYCLLDDRVHMEMAVEGAVYKTQKFLYDITEEMKVQAFNYEGDPLQAFLKRHLTDCTFYRYYPSKGQQFEYYEMKLYHKLVVKEVNSESSLNPENDVVEETDRDIRIMNESKRLMVATKMVE